MLLKKALLLDFLSYAPEGLFKKSFCVSKKKNQEEEVATLPPYPTGGVGLPTGSSQEMQLFFLIFCFPSYAPVGKGSSRRAPAKRQQRA
jgi:hypothetical protein